MYESEVDKVEDPETSQVLESSFLCLTGLFHDWLGTWLHYQCLFLSGLFSSDIERNAAKLVFQHASVDFCFLLSGCLMVTSH